jgi:hypothetical protein
LVIKGRKLKEEQIIQWPKEKKTKEQCSANITLETFSLIVRVIA